MAFRASFTVGPSMVSQWASAATGASSSIPTASPRAAFLARPFIAVISIIVLIIIIVLSYLYEH